MKPINFKKGAASQPLPRTGVKPMLMTEKAVLYGWFLACSIATFVAFIAKDRLFSGVRWDFAAVNTCSYQP